MVRAPPTLRRRTSGVLLHLTSLPGPHGSGDLGADARAFADQLVRAGQRWWQMLPVGPAGYGDSPYASLSAFAGNPLFVDLDALGPTTDRVSFPEEQVEFGKVTRFREDQLRRAYAEFDDDERLRVFEEREASWLEGWALYDALKRVHGGTAWTQWDEGVRLRKKADLARARTSLAEPIRFAKFVQLLFAEQWASFRVYCNERGLGLIGDLPIFVAHDSADVWEHRELFQLDADGQPTHVAGVPPDYFSKTGQRWGNPLYKWGLLAKDGYRWWTDRFAKALDRFDVIRLDHFIGFVRYWRIPASEATALNGTWMKGPGRALFDAVEKRVGSLPLLAEDLGEVTPAVTKLRRDLGLPGTRVVQFAFGTDPQASSFLPHNHDKNAVVYTGTHDNDTAVGWFQDPGGGVDDTRSTEQAERERQHVLAYAGRETGSPAIHWDMVRLAMASVARTCIVPAQDVLGLGSAARMNRPGTATGNWTWRMKKNAIDTETERRLLRLARTYGRAR